ncbi:MAG: stress response translation initiation inhibitor YciH [Thermoplasmata archaeon]|nr:stress response translation initiation inhibitor YciH [Thermoplasmata archaeon]HDD59882.1 stress response translation initiation inhibitor YciH [Euryarchaeota archaeon]RLF56514.1 MAG: stress response translation initiation inhibitor YciH [Thermoplasmata archaeon]RLF71184.1 MAG: stress response translation initiation inhibitor YciH [Thermoplasmata archaeon]RLF72247.1 MAG: stress response translation initiation inhibitor YciH [Thermoplasmata archaeon]
MVDICPRCGLPKDLCVCEEIAREQQQIKVTTQKRRYGKVVTVISGFDTSEIDVENLAKELKTRCAAGGTVKDDTIELQGDHKKKVIEILKEKGYKEVVEE